MQLPLSQLLLLSSCAHYRDRSGGLGMHAMQKLPVLQVNVVVMQPLAVSDPKWMSMGLGAVTWSGVCAQNLWNTCAPLGGVSIRNIWPSHWLMPVETIYLAKYTVKYLRKIWLGSLAKAIKLMRYPCNASGLNLKLVVKKKVCVLHVAKYGKRSTFQNTLKVILLLTCTKV